jgi:hypothetical protein
MTKQLRAVFGTPTSNGAYFATHAVTGVRYRVTRHKFIGRPWSWRAAALTPTGALADLPVLYEPTLDRMTDALGHGAPEPVKVSERNCFGLRWFRSEQDAERYARFIRARGDRHNGGFFHGSACDRVSQFDYTDAALGKLFAVKVA